MFAWGQVSKKGMESIRDSTARINIWEGASSEPQSIVNEEQPCASTWYILHNEVHFKYTTPSYRVSFF